MKAGACGWALALGIRRHTMDLAAEDDAVSVSVSVPHRSLSYTGWPRSRCFTLLARYSPCAEMAILIRERQALCRRVDHEHRSWWPQRHKHLAAVDTCVLVWSSESGVSSKDEG